MRYFVKNVSIAQYIGAILIKAGEERQVSKEIYTYLNTTFGASGKFTFRTAKAPKEKVTAKAPKEKVTAKAPKEKVTAKAPKEKVTTKANKNKD